MNKQQSYWQYANNSGQRFYISLFIATAVVALAYLVNLNVFDSRIPSWLIIPAVPFWAAVIHYSWSWVVFNRKQEKR